MRIPLTRYGAREILLFGGGSVIAIIACLGLGVPWLAPLPALLLLAILSFFRDPSREIPTAEGVVVAPADGKIVAMSELPGEEYLKGPVRRIDIFLAVYNVHVNRAPLAGEVLYTADRDGTYLSALGLDAGDENRARTIGFVATEGGTPFLVRQIVGAIARRIVTAVAKGDQVRRGQRIGMLKFGSRTQFALPANVPFDCRVKVGDKVKGGSTVLGYLGREDRW